MKNIKGRLFSSDLPENTKENNKKVEEYNKEEFEGDKLENYSLDKIIIEKADKYRTSEEIDK